MYVNHIDNIVNGNLTLTVNPSLHSLIGISGYTLARH